MKNESKQASSKDEEVKTLYRRKTSTQLKKPENLRHRRCQSCPVQNNTRQHNRQITYRYTYWIVSVKVKVTLGAQANPQQDHHWLDVPEAVRFLPIAVRKADREVMFRRKMRRTVWIWKTKYTICWNSCRKTLTSVKIVS